MFEWLSIAIPVAGVAVLVGLAAGFVLGILWRWRHTRGEHAFYGSEVSVSRVGQNDPRLTVAQCQERARRKRKPTAPQTLARRFALRTSTTAR